MALRKGKLVKSKGSFYFVADDLGMAYDLHMVHPQNFTDMGTMNDRIDMIGGELKKEPKASAGWLPTIGLHKATWDKIAENWKVIFQAKTHIFLYGGSATMSESDPVDSFPVISVFGFVDLVWVNDGKVFTKWGQDEFAYRFQGVPMPVADPVTPPVVVVPPPVVIPPNPDPNVPPVVTGSDFTIHVKCPHCGNNIF